MRTLHMCHKPHPFSPPGGVRETAPGEDKQDLVNEAGKQEIPLTLTNKVEKLAEEDESTNMKALFVRTKRMAVDVLKVCVFTHVYMTVLSDQHSIVRIYFSMCIFIEL